MGLRFGKDSADQEKNLGFSRLDTCSIAINNETSALPGSGGHSEQITMFAVLLHMFRPSDTFRKYTGDLTREWWSPISSWQGMWVASKPPPQLPAQRLYHTCNNKS